MPASERALELALAAAQAAADKKAEDIVIIDVADQLVITDAFLLASAPNERQVVAIVDAIEEPLLDAAGEGQAGAPRGRAGRPLGAARLRRHRGARPAHRGARVLRPRPAVEGLPDDPVRRPGPGRPTAPASASDPADPLAARPHRVERRAAGSRARPTSSSTSSGAPRPRPRPSCSPRASPTRSSPATCSRATDTAAAAGRADRPAGPARRAAAGAALRRAGRAHHAARCRAVSGGLRAASAGGHDLGHGIEAPEDCGETGRRGAAGHRGRHARRHDRGGDAWRSRADGVLSCSTGRSRGWAA